jgi:hypothetical protein
MEQLTAHIPLLRPEERIIGRAYLTEDEEIVFTPHTRAIEVVLVAPESGAAGAWAVRVRPPRPMIKDRNTHILLIYKQDSRDKGFNQNSLTRGDSDRARRCSAFCRMQKEIVFINAFRRTPSEFAEPPGCEHRKNSAPSRYP